MQMRFGRDHEGGKLRNLPLSLTAEIQAQAGEEMAIWRRDFSPEKNF